MESVFQEINELLQTLQSLQPMRHDYQQRLDKKFRLEFSYNSNHIEGNTLTYGETEMLLLFGEAIGNHSMREYDEMQGHDVAAKLIAERATDQEHPLTEADIKNLNRIILKEPFWKEAITTDGQPTRRLITVGDYKEHPNSVRLQNGELFQYASPVETPIQMHELLGWYRAEEKEIHPVTLAAMLHYKFVRIHPFDDGNGRISRLLVNYVLLRNGLPPVIVKSADKKNYLRALQMADTGNYEPFIAYIAEQVIWSLQVSIKAANGERIDEPDDIDKEIALLSKKLSQKDTVAHQKNSVLLIELLNDSLIPLFLLLEEKCEKLQPLFVRFTKSVWYASRGEKLINLEANNWEEIKKSLKGFIDSDSSFQSLRYSCFFEGLKSSLTRNHFGFYLDFSFQPFHFTLKINEGKEQTFPYQKPLTTQEKNDIVSFIMKDLIARIEKAAQ